VVVPLSVKVFQLEHAEGVTVAHVAPPAGWLSQVIPVSDQVVSLTACSVPPAGLLALWMSVVWIRSLALVTGSTRPLVVNFMRRRWPLSRTKQGGTISRGGVVRAAWWPGRG
jgi:hypothetical protein